MQRTDLHGPAARRWAGVAAIAVCATLAACSGSGGGGGDDPGAPVPKSPAASVPAGWGTALPADQQPGLVDTARFLAQATFGPVSPDEITSVRRIGYAQWLERQFALPAPSHLAYVRSSWQRDDQGRVREEAPYEAIWQHWLYSEDQLRARVAFALSQIFVISNVAPDLQPEAMASYMDMLNRNAFGNWRTLVQEVTLHPAMGYYLNMLGSEKEDPAKGRLPNENFARELLQLFSIGLETLGRDGTVLRDAQGKPVPTYDQNVVLGFAKALSGWSFGGRDTSSDRVFVDNDENGDWTIPMAPWPSKHSGGTKLLLDGRVLPAGQSAQRDLADALDQIFMHPNTPPFFARRMIQRLTTSNPSPAYVARVAAAFENDGTGARGELRAVVRAVLLDPEARDAAAAMAGTTAGKQREPVIRFANLLRALGAKADSGTNMIRYLDSADEALGQSPLLAPTVFNFFTPDFRMPGAMADAGLVAPEFQITNETTVVGTLNFFAKVVREKGYGWGERRSALDYAPLESIANDPAALVGWVDTMFTGATMDATTRASMLKAVQAISASRRGERVRAALLLAMIAPDFVIQR
jgi:uncharacterized protein (DUF1800 family)